MICKRCFRLSDDDMSFCPYCGKAFADDVEDAPNEKTNAEDTEAPETEAHGGAPEEKEPINLWNDGPTSYYYRSEQTYAQPEREQSPIGKLFSSMLHAICYFILFLVIQSVVATGFQLVAAFAASAEYTNNYFEEHGINIEALSDEEYLEIIETITIESESVMMDAMLAVDTNMISAVASVVVVLALLVLAKYKRRKFSDHTSLYFAPLKNPRAWAAIPAGIAMHSIVLFIISIIPFPESVIESYNELYAFIGESPLWLEIIAVVVLAPIVEELVFRGCIHSRLRRSMKPLTAALISAFIFGVAHGHIISVVYAFTLGLVLTYLYERYNSVVIPMIFHAAFNGANYLPIITENTTFGEVFIIVAVSSAIFAICAVIIASGPAQKETDNENDKGI